MKEYALVFVSHNYYPVDPYLGTAYQIGKSGPVTMRTNPFLALYNIDEDKHKFNNKFNTVMDRVLLNSCNPRDVPSERFHYHDFKRLMDSYADIKTQHYRPLVGFYSKTAVLDESRIRLGDLILITFNNNNHEVCILTRVKNIRGKITSWLFGKYELENLTKNEENEPVVFNIESFTQGFYVDYNKTYIGKTTNYILTKVKNETIFS